MPIRSTSDRVRRCALRACACALVLGSGVLGAQSVEGVREAIASEVPQAAKLLGAAAITHGADAALAQLYAQDAATPLWSREGEPTAQARALLNELRGAESYGLRAGDYGGAELAHLLEGAAPAGPAREQRLARFDARLTCAALRFISDLHFGRVSPAAAGFKLDQPREPFDLVQALRSIATAADVSGALTATEPVFYHYKLLKDALAQYRKIAASVDPAALPPITKTVKVGDSYAGAPALRHLLQVLGDLPPGPPPSATDTTYDAALAKAVSAYQDRHGLDDDGFLGKRTLAQLRTPLAQRIRQITLTLERWRWLAPFKTPPIIVNIPEFRLYAFRSTEDRVADILQMDVIVGRTFAHTQTPVFEGEMRYVVLRPYWDVPMSITRNELLPKIHANPGYLAHEHLELVAGQSDNSPVVPPTPQNLARLAHGELRLRQQPGEDNALGLIKFMFPNSYNVYLHSTPAHQLFKQSVRTFSHGCIRVAHPVALASLVLKDTDGDWTRAKILEAMAGGANSQRVNLKRPISVLIVYGTALATEGGRCSSSTISTATTEGSSSSSDSRPCAEACRYQRRTAPLSRCTKSDCA